MQTQKTRWLHLTRPMAAALAAAASCGAWAADDPNPYYIGASQEFAHDSNVFRTPDPVPDYFSSTGLIGGFDQLISRQRLYANANVHYNKYKNQTSLDNTSYGVNAGWDWATIERLAGNFNVEANQALATFNGNSIQATASRNLVKTDQFSTKVLWGGDGLINLTGAYSHSRVKYSAVEYLPSESSNDTSSLGVNYRLGEDLRVGLAYRFSRTKSPFAIPLVPNPVGPDDYGPNTSNGRNVDLTLDWRFTPKTHLYARLSQTRLTNSDANALDFNGTTGALIGSFAPTGKLSFNASVARDAGLNTTFFNANAAGTAPGTPVTGLTQNTQTTDSYSLGAVYAATAKISLTANLLYRHSKVVTPTEEESDNGRISSLGATYEVARSWQLGCRLSHESRSLSGAGGFSYSANIVGCSAQLKLQ
ncbi:MAG: hypothetical protein ABI887_11685 [Burkholderiales bacterium]